MPKCTSYCQAASGAGTSCSAAAAAALCSWAATTPSRAHTASWCARNAATSAANSARAPSSVCASLASCVCRWQAIFNDPHRAPRACKTPVLNRIFSQKQCFSLPPKWPFSPIPACFVAIRKENLADPVRHK